MSIESKTTLKSHFKTNDVITQTNVYSLIDSSVAVAQGTDTNTYNIRAVNEGTTTGNARGENSVDLQTKRSNAAYVAAGANSSILGGENNGITAVGTHSTIVGGKGNHSNSGSYCSISGYNNHTNSGNICSISGYGNNSNAADFCIISGYGNSGNSFSGYSSTIAGSSNTGNSGKYCSISGYNNHTNSGNICSISGSYNHTNSGPNCSISGYQNNNNSGSNCNISGVFNSLNSGSYCSISGYNNSVNSGDCCSISGKYATNNNLDYARVHGGGPNARIIDLVAKTTTTNTTPKAITLGGAAEGLDGSIIIPANTAWAFTVHVVAIDVTNSFANSKKFSFDGLCLNDGGSVTVSAYTLGTDATQGLFSGSVSLSADTTYDALRIMATGIGTDTIRWTAQINLTQVD